jgi:serine/threonine-protein kinase
VIRGGAAANPALDALVGGQPVPEERVGTVIAARYRLDRRLGAGGVGDVYLASALPEERRVAVKLLRRELGLLPEVVALFEREAAAASRIDHPNVAGALDFGRLQDGSLYLVLEYVAGASLAEVLRERGAARDRPRAADRSRHRRGPRRRAPRRHRAPRPEARERDADGAPGPEGRSRW